MTPSQGEGLTVLSVGDGILTHLSFSFPDPTDLFFKNEGELKTSSEK
jgi:hypothetical protein